MAAKEGSLMPPSKVTATYNVGKGRPPVATRWKRGQSGNPKGRPGGSQNLFMILRKALKRKITIEKRGKRVKITVREAIIMRLTQSAMNGDIKAIDYLLRFEPELERRENSGALIPEITDDMSNEEAAAIFAASLKEGEHG
jgi:hypothetical protein